MAFSITLINLFNSIYVCICISLLLFIFRTLLAADTSAPRPTHLIMGDSDLQAIPRDYFSKYAEAVTAHPQKIFIYGGMIADMFATKDKKGFPMHQGKNLCSVVDSRVRFEYFWFWFCFFFFFTSKKKKERKENRKQK